MTELTAPLAGTVSKIHVRVGDKVRLDDEMIVIEALKMETPVYSESDGTLAQLRVREGQIVNEGDVLAVID